MDGTTWQYVYDLGGNILSKSSYAFTTDVVGAAIGTNTYAYGDANWKDKLAVFNGNPITYDLIGNPLSYDSWTYEWQAGRQLKSMTHRDDQGVQDKKLEFSYDAAGLRTQKKYTYTDAQSHTVVETTDYILHGKLLMHQKTTTTINGGQPELYQLHFYYDAASRPIMVRVGNEKAECKYYSYIHSLQGDILGIIDRGQDLVVEYAYDPWGKLLEARSLKTECEKLARLNPFRYRGYVYGEETMLYYLRSRYYNPEWNRFVISDTLLGDQGKNMAHNYFAYCLNNPGPFFDPSGNERHTTYVFIDPYTGKPAWIRGYRDFSPERKRLAEIVNWVDNVVSVAEFGKSLYTVGKAALKASAKNLATKGQRVTRKALANRSKEIGEFAAGLAKDSVEDALWRALDTSIGDIVANAVYYYDSEDVPFSADNIYLDESKYNVVYKDIAPEPSHGEIPPIS